VATDELAIMFGTGEIILDAQGTTPADLLTDDQRHALARGVLQCVIERNLLGQAMQTLGGRKWLNMRQACEYLGVSENKIKELCRMGFIYGMKPQRLAEWRIDRESIDQYLNSQRSDENDKIQNRLLKVAGRNV
jgi:excisionase family DNA binding protein